MGYQMQGVQELLVLPFVTLEVKGHHTGILTVHELFSQLMLGMAL